ncbi:MAG: single-stranded-DNA-specific exonuclease RecJ, partial [Verrucomicrobia bacterium]
MSRIWKLKPIGEPVVRETATITGLPMPLARALALRGYRAPDEIEAFLNPRLSGLSDPFLLPDMQKAVSRLWNAIDAAETITVFGDYDVDGVTAAAVLTRILTALGADVKPFIPDRLDEGYGLSRDALDRCLAAHGSTLVVTVDCGTNAVESVAHAQARGVDVIVTDHHEPDEHTATAFALINPKLGNVRDLEILSGAGVAFKLSHAVLKAGRDRGTVAANQVDLRDYLDLVALGTVTDLVPLNDENRIIARYGLAALNRTKWEGLRALKAVSGMRDEADTYHLGFQLGPRINAAGRIGQPMQALRLLTTDDPAEAREIADLLDRTNLERRKLERDMAEEAFAEIEAYFDPEKHFGLVVAKEGWHPGVVGIVASRVSRHYNRPAVVMGIDKDGKVRGSCRSIDAFDVLGGLRTCERYLIKYGGHKMAAGAELPVDSLEAFASAFNAAATTLLKSLDLSPVQHIDAEITGSELDWRFFEQLKKLNPFGQDNPEPVWALYGVEVAGKPRVVGQKHLKLSLVFKGRKFDAIAFNYPLKQLSDGGL